jgi:hypothetical protein
MHAMDNFKIATNSSVTLRGASCMFRSLHDHHQGGFNKGMARYGADVLFPYNLMISSSSVQMFHTNVKTHANILHTVASLSGH